MEDMKFRIDSPAQSEALQNVLFGLGYSWGKHGTGGVEYRDEPFLFADNDKSLSWENDLEFFEDHPIDEQNTNDFIAKHTKKANMTNSNTATELTFDINADISRQYTRNGVKIHAIYKNTTEGIEPAFKVLLDGNSGHSDYSGDGKNLLCNSPALDIITRPIEKPLNICFMNAYAAGFGCEFGTYEQAIQQADANLLATIKLTFNPNDNSISAIVVTK